MEDTEKDVSVVAALVVNKVRFHKGQCAAGNEMESRFKFSGCGFSIVLFRWLTSTLRAGRLAPIWTVHVIGAPRMTPGVLREIVVHVLVLPYPGPFFRVWTKLTLLSADHVTKLAGFLQPRDPVLSAVPNPVSPLTSFD